MSSLQTCNRPSVTPGAKTFNECTLAVQKPIPLISFNIPDGS